MISLVEPSRDSGCTKTITLSQNETESLCMKAARGAGFSWGLAEEAGFAAGWLAALGVDATPQLLALLMQKLQATPHCGTPVPQPGHWRATGQALLCPIILGSALVDSARLAAGPCSRDTKLDPVAVPVLLLPFLARAAQICGKPLAVIWPEGSLQIAANGSFDRPAAIAWQSKDQLALVIGTANTLDMPQAQSHSLPSISLAALNGLTALALKTTVPATDASRRGAGSASADND